MEVPADTIAKALSGWEARDAGDGLSVIERGADDECERLLSPMPYAVAGVVEEAIDALAALAAVTVEGCVPPIGTPDTGGDQGSEPPLLAHPVGGTEPVNNNDPGRTTLDGRSAAGVEEKGA